MANNNSIEGLKGTWDYISGDNFDGILKELGINKVLRTIAKNPNQRLKQHQLDFLPDVEFQDVSPDGQKFNIIVRFENGIWIQTVRYKDGKEMFVKRWINDQDQLQVTMECGKTKANQLFKRIA